MNTIEYLEKEIKDVDKELIKVDEQLAKWKNTQRQLHKKKASLKESIDKLKSDSLARVDWEGNTYEWSEDVKRILKNVFNIESFRPKQLSAINLTLSGHHALVVMPTGAGKSLCYQLPALLRPGITVVISPLVSQMEHQVRSLTNKNIAAMLVTSTSSNEQTTAALNALEDEDTQVKLLYVTPEILAKSKQFIASLQKCYADRRLQRIAIDEVHCCSQWGHDFRPDYKNLGILSNLFPNVPILGLTATDTAHVLADAQKILNIAVCLVIKSTFNRPNLYYKILDKPSSQEDCLNIIEKLLKQRYKGESGIIYTNSIKDSRDVAEGLRERGLKVGCYHEDMNADCRSKVYLKWHENYYQAIVTNVAFGIAIDKPDVRFVIHHTMSRSMENYYHECLRAGRDGHLAECITLYRMQDIFKPSSMVFSSGGKLDHLYGMVKYCLNGTFCRRQLIAEHFDEDWGDADCSNMCDVCSTNTLSQEISLEPHCKTISNIIIFKYGKLTAQKLLDIWFRNQSSVTTSSRKGGHNITIMPTFSRTVGEDIVAFLLVQGYLKEHFTALSTISYIKIGPNMGSIYDANFTLKMQARKITTYENDEFFKNGREEGIESKRRKSSSSRSSSCSSSSSLIFVPKKSKIFVIEDDEG